MLKFKEMPIAEIIPYENNPRKNEVAVDAVAESIKAFGFRVPIIVDADNIIVAGHTRLKAAEKLGLDAVPVIIADDLTEDQVKAFRLADNKTGEMAEWDFDRLKQEMEGIKNISMKDFGFVKEDTISISEYFEEDNGEKEEKKKKIYTCPVCGKEFEV